jgi:hypothetical protein
MRAIDFYRQRLDEIMMSPRSLRKEASDIMGALVGMEFEMYVPDVEGGDDSEFEPDYDMDERADSIDQIIEFFENDDGGGYNSSRQLRRLREELEQKYQEWCDDELKREWREIGKEVVSDFIANDAWDQDDAILEALGKMDLSEEEIEAAIEAGKGHSGLAGEFSADALASNGESARMNWKLANGEANKVFRTLVDESWENEDDNYDNAYDEWKDDQDLPDESDFLNDQDYDSMSNIESEFDIMWPHIRQLGGEGNFAEVAASFQKALGKNVKYGEDYHSVRRDNTSYILEPDGSLDEPNDRNNNDKGLEFVSPPMPIADMLIDLAKVKKWANYNNCYTNDSTGLHINISVPGFSIDKLDYVKLALLLGDEYVLRNFNRFGNTYAPPAIDKIKQNIATRTEDAEGLLQSMHTGLSQLASKAIHGGHTNKYCSINTKDGYVEFRSPGEDWLGTNFEKIESTLLRMVVALDAACDVTKYQQEYAKKLYKLLTHQQMGRRADTGELKQAPDMNDNDIITVFSQYSAGKLPRAALKSFVKSFQMQRKKEKMHPDDNLAPMEKVEADWRSGWARWMVKPYNMLPLPISARSSAEAAELARSQYPEIIRLNGIESISLDPSTPAHVRNRMHTGGGLPNPESGAGLNIGRWRVYNSAERYAEVNCLRANAVHAAMNQNPELFPYGVPSVDRVEAAPTMTQGELNLSDFGPEYADNGPVTSETQWWFRVSVGERGAQTVAARTTQEARDKAREEFSDMDIPNDQMEVVAIRRVDPSAAGVVDRSNNGNF